MVSQVAFWPIVLRTFCPQNEAFHISVGKQSLCWLYMRLGSMVSQVAFWPIVLRTFCPQNEAFHISVGKQSLCWLSFVLTS